MEEETENSANNRPWLFKKGQSGNPGGRPKGKSMKDYSREYLQSLTDEERLEFLEGIPKVDIWKMSEGMPSQHTDLTSGGKPLYLPPELLNKNELTQEPSRDSEGHTQV